MDKNLETLALLSANQCLLAVCLNLTRNKLKPKKLFSAKWLLRRESEGFTNKLLKEILDEDTRLFRTVLRITPIQFQAILEKVTPLIQKQDTTFRKSISPAERLQVTLIYLATGSTQTFLQFTFRIQQSTISRIIKETVSALYNVLKNEYFKFPASMQDWLNISQEFFDLWGFPHCIGAIDGKHCKVKPMKKFGSNYWCYKGFHSFILMAISDARYRFIYVDVGVNGRIGDACLWLNSDLKNAIEKGSVHIPPAEKLPMSDMVTPYTLIADDAFPLNNYILKPFSHLPLTNDEERFNRMLSRSRRVVENAFGILANRFQVLFTPIFREPIEAIKIVLAAVCLHNYLREENIRGTSIQDNPTENQIDGIVGLHYDNYTPGPTTGKSKASAVHLRNTIKDYFKQHKDHFNLN